jgi:hypothetical protein
MRKAEISLRQGRPTINVKCYSFGDVDAVMARFHCTKDVAQKALEFAYESAVASFWERADEHAERSFGESVEVGSEGRSAGWLVVENLDYFESWNAVMVSRWSGFENAIHAEMKYFGSEEHIMEAIETNRWAEPRAELFNFIDTPTGKKCAVDLNAHLAKAKQEFLGGSNGP